MEEGEGQGEWEGSHVAVLLNSVQEGNYLRWDGRRSPFYEIYYLRLLDPAKNWSFWIRYTLLSPTTKGILPSASLWAIFHEGGKPPIALKSTIPLHELDIFHADRFIQIRDSYLSLAQAVGELSDSDHHISWNLDFEDPTVSLALYPYRALYSLPFPRTKFLEPRFVTHVTGSITIDRLQIPVNQSRAHQAHLWGTAYARQWTWGFCDSFLEDPETRFEGLIARVSLGPFSSPPLRLFYFSWKGREFFINNLVHWRSVSGSEKLLEWQFEAQSGKTKFAGRLWREASDCVGLEYTGPSGEKRFCHNTMATDMELTLFERSGKEWVFVEKLTSSKGAAFETVEPSPDPHVHFVL